MEAVWSSMRVARRLGSSDCVVRRCWNQWIREVSFTRITGSGRPRQTSRLEERYIVSDESRFNLSSDDNHVRLWRPRAERLNPAFALQRHATPAAGVMIWGAIAYNTRLPLVLIRGTKTAQRYVHDILQPVVLPLMQRLQGAIFQQDNVQPLTAMVSQDCVGTVTTLPWPA
ncbi:transposable element Tcb2 transposase [Trichonephila clavipes]|uniref:Transposable element Tcb2 transposase n=1 Tax=Trichonephila clavipes TaxID=2585209 RepID=A0A8X6UTX4_TRICX|nr:transposable element Tcb2 transposase [Trichonephila clavipes]